MLQSKSRARTEERPATGTTDQAGGPETTTRPRGGAGGPARGDRANRRGRRGHTLARVRLPRVPLAWRAASVGPRGVPIRTTCRRAEVAQTPPPPAEGQPWR